MSRNSSPDHEVEPGGTILIRDATGTEVHLFLPGCRHVDDLSSLFADILEAMQTGYGPIKSSEERSHQDLPDGWPRFRDWKRCSGTDYFVELRSFEHYYGASWGIEQVLIGLGIAGGYDLAKYIAKQIADKLREEVELSKSGEIDYDLRTRIESLLTKNFGAIGPIQFPENESLQDDQWHQVSDGNGRLFRVRIDSCDVLFIAIDK